MVTGRPPKPDLAHAENVISIVRDRLRALRERAACMHPHCPTLDMGTPCCDAYEINQILDVIEIYEEVH